MSIVALGLAEEFRSAGIACNGLWPATTIATAAVRYAFGGESALQRARKPAIVADAAHEVLCSDARRITGRFLLDEDVLRDAGVRDFDAYQYAPGETLTRDLFVQGRKGGRPARSAPTTIVALLAAIVAFDVECGSKLGPARRRMLLVRGIFRESACPHDVAMVRAEHEIARSEGPASGAEVGGHIAVPKRRAARSPTRASAGPAGLPAAAPRTFHSPELLELRLPCSRRRAERSAGALASRRLRLACRDMQRTSRTTCCRVVCLPLTTLAGASRSRQIFAVYAAT